MLMFTSVSVKVAPVKAIPLVLLKVKVIVDVPPMAMDAGAKALAIVGATAVTVRFAVLDAAPATGVWVLTTPDVVFGLVPTMSDVTTTVTVQLPGTTPTAAGMVRPLKLSTV